MCAANVFLLRMHKTGLFEHSPTATKSAQPITNMCVRCERMRETLRLDLLQTGETYQCNFRQCPNSNRWDKLCK